LATIKLVNSKIVDKNLIWKDQESELDYFTEENYDGLKEFILEKSIPDIQQSIKDGQLSYEELTKFYMSKQEH